MEKNREKIISELKKNKEGYTISELSKKLNLSRQTIANCFAFLEGAQKVKIRKAGMAKIYYWGVEKWNRLKIAIKESWKLGKQTRLLSRILKK